jgi:hypothetical protein
MNKESAENFWRKLCTDEAFLNELARPGANRKELLRREGFDFTPQEFSQLLKRFVNCGVEPFQEAGAIKAGSQGLPSLGGSRRLSGP